MDDVERWVTRGIALLIGIGGLVAAGWAWLRERRRKLRQDEAEDDAERAIPLRTVCRELKAEIKAVRERLDAAEKKHTDAQVLLARQEEGNAHLRERISYLEKEVARSRGEDGGAA